MISTQRKGGNTENTEVSTMIFSAHVLVAHHYLRLNRLLPTTGDLVLAYRNLCGLCTF